ncbi:MAG: TonB-dependent receptor [Dysgonamonadaceae bacterium]|jgi:TonB-linked SusC/RagA family outer membrane protein|nr:TonB-dependent receptor [Dysgonamonadaceae bacterium]
MTKKHRKKNGLTAAFLNKRRLLFVLLLLLPMTLLGQTFNVSGTVTDGNNEFVIGASVIVKGQSSVGTITDADGIYNIPAKIDDVLIFSYLGMTAQEVPVNGRMRIDVKFSERDFVLEDIVVVGYGVQKKKLVTGSTVQVKGEDIAKLSTVSALSALSSLSPGVSIVRNNNKPGEGFKVNIRGLGTIGDASPLYIIDGVIGGDIDLLNPSEIETIDILKDAASTAIYGSRAANGVILVTTKHGVKGKPTTSVDMYYGWQNLYKKLQTLNAQEYANIMNEGRMNDGLAPWDFATLIPTWDKIQNGWTGTNWLDEMTTENAPVQNYALNITGGSEQSVYSVGLGYTSQVGMVGGDYVHSQYERYNGRINSEYTLLKNSKFDILKFGENLTFAYTNREGLDIAADGPYWNDMRWALNMHPFMPVYDKDGEFTKSYIAYHDEANPVAYMYYARKNNNAKNYSLRGNFYATLQPIQRLILRSSFGFGYSSYNNRSYIPVYDTGAAGILQTQDQTNQSAGGGFSWIWDNTANYEFSIAEDSHFGVMIGMSAEKWGMGAGLSGSNVNSEFGDYKHAYLDNNKLVDPVSTSLGGAPWGAGAIASYFGRLNYDYKGKYMATINMRRDGSSNFMRGHRWSFFPSLSAGWMITEESFAESLRSFVNYFKLRGSWGRNGNMNIDNYQYLATINIGGAGYTFGGDKSSQFIGSYPDILANPGISWEKSDQLDFGFDARFINHLTVAFDWYDKTTKDWLVRAPVLASYGTGAPFINGGDINNHGIEFALGWNDNIGDFKYGANINMAHNVNKVIRIANQEGIINGSGDILSSQSGYFIRAQEGYPIGYFYGYKTNGIFQNEAEVQAYKHTDGSLIMPEAKPGDVRFTDMDHDGKITDKDRTMIGDPNPDYTLGLSLNAEWKGIDFSITGNGAFGQQIARSYRSFGDRPWHNFTMDIAANRWHGEGTSNRYPRITSSPNINWSYLSDIYVENGDYLRISNITLGYDFKKSFKNIPLQQVRVYCSVQNAFTFTGYPGMDPEIGYGGDGSSWSRGVDLGFYPSPRTVIVGANIIF